MEATDRRRLEHAAQMVESVAEELHQLAQTDRALLLDKAAIKIRITRHEPHGSIRGLVPGRAWQPNPRP